ncbi:tyrosine-type recombinase/integrase [Pareuzebyella sediminis]|uniref:tyrosine-type recombinase/integrase n=1 Tax=Pareuzebyella sediminis TaxID=2607998 RepID=UPI001E537B2C|nr:site-specific integrase [Pareuzebyella sediminis]
MKPNYSEPKIYAGGVDIYQWSSLSKKEQKEALQKSWYVYYSFRNPKTGLLVRQNPIKGGANRFRDKRSRYHILKQMQEALNIVLQEGFNPYQQNTKLIEYLENRLDPNKEEASNLKDRANDTPPDHANNKHCDTGNSNENSLSITKAFKIGMETKERVMGKDSFTKFKSRVGRFRKWMAENGIKEKQCIEIIDKKLVIRYLNSVLQNTSPRNRNNTRTDLGSLFQTLEDNDIIKNNFIRKINVLRAIPTRHKSYTPQQLEKIENYLIENEPVFRIFVLFISYNFLRPIEVCRLKIKDIDLEGRELSVKAKNKPVKTKIIPDILFEELPDLSRFNQEDFLFTMDGFGGNWDITESSKRDYFSKKFKKIKDYFNLGKDYGLYSFRHTYITKMYREMVKDSTPFEAKSELMLITGHATMHALEKYLRDIDAELPKDYSHLLK